MAGYDGFASICQIHKELEKALSAEDEATLKKALGRFEQNALYDPVALNRARARQAAYDKIRDDLRAAVRSRSMERIAFVLSEFEAHRLIDDGMIERSLDRMLSLAESGNWGNDMACILIVVCVTIVTHAFMSQPPTLLTITICFGLRGNRRECIVTYYCML